MGRRASHTRPKAGGLLGRQRLTFGRDFSQTTEALKEGRWSPRRPWAPPHGPLTCFGFSTGRGLAGGAGLSCWEWGGLVRTPRPPGCSSCPRWAARLGTWPTKCSHRPSSPWGPPCAPPGSPGPGPAGGTQEAGTVVWPWRLEAEGSLEAEGNGREPGSPRATAPREAWLRAAPHPLRTQDSGPSPSPGVTGRCWQPLRLLLGRLPTLLGRLPTTLGPPWDGRRGGSEPHARFRSPGSGGSSDPLS